MPDEKEIREYAKYAAKVREIVQDEMMKVQDTQSNPYLITEIARSATMPIGIWMGYHNASGADGTGEKLDPKTKREILLNLKSKYDLMETGIYLKPKKNLIYGDFQTLRIEMLAIGYIYEIGKGFRAENP
jgi:hypothetical protein